MQIDEQGLFLWNLPCLNSLNSSPFLFFKAWLTIFLQERAFSFFFLLVSWIISQFSFRILSHSLISLILLLGFFFFFFLTLSHVNFQFVSSLILSQVSIFLEETEKRTYRVIEMMELSLSLELNFDLFDTALTEMIKFSLISFIYLLILFSLIVKLGILDLEKLSS